MPHEVERQEAPRKSVFLTEVGVGWYLPANPSLLLPDERLESRTRRVLSNTYQKLIQSVFLDDSIPNGVKYLINFTSKIKTMSFA
ncbi:hypothetical protein CB1_000535001 [Camelus ferus]|nr:hypothetical protein CB1_000535001 [Camelus ferus]